MSLRSAGEPDFPTPEHIREAAKAAIDRNESRYTDVAGTLALREAVVRKFQLDNGLTFSPQQIQVGCGAKQLLYNALQATVNPGDEVVIPTQRGFLIRRWSSLQGPASHRPL